MMSLWDALRMNMMISYQELVRTFLSITIRWQEVVFRISPGVAVLSEYQSKRERWIAL